LDTDIFELYMEYVLLLTTSSSFNAWFSYLML
jgi:hypothetical protein